MLGLSTLFLVCLAICSAERIKDDLIYKKLTINSTRWSFNSAQCNLIPEERRVDCYPEALQTGNSNNRQACLERKCCYKEEHGEGNTPWCYFPTSYEAYTLTSHKESETGQFIEMTRKTHIPYSNLFQRITIKITYLNENSLRVSFNTSEERLFVPPIVLDLPKFEIEKAKQYDVNLVDNVITVYRKSNRALIWSADLNTLIMSEQFNQLHTSINSNVVSGLGEHKDDYEKIVQNRKRVLFFNRDEPPRPDKSLYGHHPFYLNHEVTNGAQSTINAHSVLLLNTHPIELIMMNKPALLWRTLGGSFDFFINLGPTPMQAIQQHVQIVGLPPLVPYWSLGFHLCRFGYNHIDNAKRVTERTIRANIPYDVMWLDIDFMQDRTMFMLNQRDFGGFKQWIDELHSKDMKFIPIIDPGIDDSYPEHEYPIYYEGLRQDVYIKHASGDILRAKVWSKAYNAWVDFSHPNATKFWTDAFIEWNKKTGFDGAWIDMNEPAQEWDGSSTGCDWNHKYERPQYIPPGLEPLAHKTSCMTAKHHGGVHYDVHNVYNYYEVQATRKALLAMKKRPFIISRATVSGFGRFGSHWTGDVFSTWEDLQASIPNLLEFNLFGIPVVGADICGFIWDTNEELCSRWSAVGSFYTFSRNHNTIGVREQDPVAMGPVVEEAARSALRIRYSLLPLLYTELFKSSQDGRPVARALNFVFPQDLRTYGIKNQFLWADKLMIAPVLEPGVRFLSTYFPAGVWFSYPNLDLWSNTRDGEYKEVELPWEKIGVFVRGGSILNTQEPKQTTAETRKGDFRLLVVLDENNSAEGDLYMDDGDSYDIETTKNYSFVKFNATNNVITSYPEKTTYKNVPKIARVDILGAGLDANVVKVNDRRVDFVDKGQNRISFNANVDMLEKFKIEWHY